MKNPEPLDTKLCPRCEHSLSLDCFGKNRSTEDGLATYCKVCQKEIHQERKARKRGL
jgi:transcription elongation factor Elf1